MDISSYFEYLDHRRIKILWKQLLGVEELPRDHYAVFKAITKYRVVDSRAANTALGYFGQKESGTPGYLKPKREMPKQLCTPQDFRDKICGEADGFTDLVQKHEFDDGTPIPYGIPQGAPLSDLLANLYLIDFDTEMNALMRSLGGWYMRYSDDILLIIPSSETNALNLKTYTQERISAYGDKLEIKERKCSIHQFRETPSGLQHVHVFPTERTSNGLSYLGLRFDGKHVYLKDGTLSNFWRKATSRINGEATNIVSRYRGKDLSFLQEKFDLDRILQSVGRVRDFEPSSDKTRWTFWTYVRRADKIFGKASRILHQTRGYRNKIRQKANECMAKTYFKAASASDHSLG